MYKIFLKQIKSKNKCLVLNKKKLKERRGGQTKKTNTKQ